MKNFKTLTEEVKRMTHLFSYTEGSLITEVITPEEMDDIGRVSIRGAAGAGKAEVLIDGKSINAKGTGYKVYEVAVVNDKVQIYISSLLGDKERTMGHFSPRRNGGYSFIQTTAEEKETYATFKAKATTE